jgi:IPTL-CTERM motif
MDFIRSSSKVALTVLLSFGLLGTAGAQVFYFDSFGGFVTGTDFPAATGTFANDSETATGGGTYDVGADADARSAANLFVDVSWGTATGVTGPYSGKSGFALSKVNDGTVNVNGAEVEFGKLTHFNRPINVGTELQYVQLDWTLQLFDTPAAAASDSGAFYSRTLSFTLYNWETPNSPASNPAYSVSYDDGATWTTIGPGVCPGSTPAGTLIVGPFGKIFRSDFVDRPTNPIWNGECADAHIYEGSPANVYTFYRDGREYRIELIGFYGPTGALTGTFWACESHECFGTVKFRITDVTPGAIPTLSQWALILLALMLGAIAALRVSRGGRVGPSA